MIYPREYILAAFARASDAIDDQQCAIAAVAQSLGLPYELVAECIEIGEVME